MWLADPGAGDSANLWLLLITVVTSSTTLLQWWISTRRGKNPASRDAADDAVRQYKRMFADPLHEENKRLRRLLAECEEDRDD